MEEESLGIWRDRVQSWNSVMVCYVYVDIYDQSIC